MAVTFVVGGARSGKSSYAEQLCKERGKKVCYLATAKVIDKDMEDRVAKHKASRPREWSTIEQYKNFDMIVDQEAFIESDTFLLDCITIMITNIMFDDEIDYDKCNNHVIDEVEKKVFVEIEKLLKTMKKEQKNMIIVSNEVGSGIVPAYRVGSIFRDIAGRVNQYIAKEADEVYHVICGLPQKLK